MEFCLNPSRERMNLTLVMALLVNGRTVIENFAWAPCSERFAGALKEFGLQYSIQGKSLVLDGKGYQFSLPSLLPYGFGDAEDVLLWTLASKDYQQVYSVLSESDKEGIEKVVAVKEKLLKYFKLEVEIDAPAKFVFRFSPEEPAIKKDSLGNIPYIMRNRYLLRALIRGEYLSFEEKSSVHDQWTKLLIYFGVGLKYEGRGVEQLSEFERRLLMAQGKKVERTQFTEIMETKVITGRDYFIPGDTTEAMALALLTTIGNVPKENVIRLLNVDLNTSRASALTCLKRMGANIEIVSRREKYGDVFGDIEVFPMEAGKRLQGRRFSEESIAGGIEEYPFLAVAACFAEGETILRLPKEIRNKMRSKNEFLAENLRKTGAEIGVYDDGMVIRGLETVMNGNDFDCGKSPQIGLALNVLSVALQNEEDVAHSEIVELLFPDILQKLKKVLVAENVEGKS